MLKSNMIYCVDCLEGMSLLDDNSIDLVVTSPPYDNVRDYDVFSLDLHAVGIEISRILKSGGICVMVIQDGTVRGRKTGTSFRTIVDWDMNTDLDIFEVCIYYRGGTPGVWWNKRFRVDHEYIAIFLKGDKPQYFSKEHMMLDAKTAGKTMTNWNRKTNGDLTKKTTAIRNDKKCPGTVLNYQSDKGKQNFSSNIKKKHPATFPDKLAEDFIKCFTTEGMLVLDPFVGSGTTAVMAKTNKRQFIGFDSSKKYCAIARERLQDA